MEPTKLSSLSGASELADKLRVLEENLKRHEPLLVAYSGGVDSTCLLALAHRALGNKVTGVIADSPSLPRAALAEALAVAETIGAKVDVMGTNEFEDPRYVSNPVNRCYFCKSELFSGMDRMAGERGFAAIAYGENADDPAHLRPGSMAAKEFSVLAPLKEAGLTKAEVREVSLALGLPTHDAPAQPCLSSRVPHGTPVTREVISLVEAGEAFVKRMGFKVFRVRYVAGPPAGAKLQVAPEEMGAIEKVREEILEGLRRVGFAQVEIDPEGYRSAAG